MHTNKALHIFSLCMVQTGLVGCFQIRIYVKDLSVSTLPGEFDEGVLAGWVCILLIYGGAHTLVTHPDGHCKWEINLNINAVKVMGHFLLVIITLAFLRTEVPMHSFCWQQ